MPTRSSRLASRSTFTLRIAFAFRIALVLGIFSTSFAHAATFTVDSNGDDVDATPGDGVCATAANACTLRAAVGEANALAAGAPHSIQFASGMVITLASKIVSTRAGTVIDATQGAPAPPSFSVELAGVTANAIELAGGTSTIHGLVIRGFQGAAVELTSAGNRVTGNRIGTNAAGTAAAPNAWAINVAGADSQIGGTGAGEGNLISGNISWGIFVEAAGSGSVVNGTRIQGNLIGLDATGTTALGNGLSGIVLSTNVSNVLIGGDATAARNVISGHTTVNRAGIALHTSTSGRNVIVGNYIGTDVSGSVALGNFWGIDVQSTGLTGIGGLGDQSNLISGNSAAGIHLSNSDITTILGNRIGVDATGTTALPNGEGIMVRGGSRFTRIGSSDPRETNVVSGNAGAGIRFREGAVVDLSVVEGNLIGLSGDGSNPISNDGGGIVLEDQDTFVRIAGNRIASTVAALAIDLGDDGVTLNDPLDVDFAGPNALLNFPLLSAASSNGVSTEIAGSYSGKANTTLRVELFATPVCHASLHGDARSYLGSTDVTTNGAGVASFQVTLPVGVTVGHLVTATATDPSASGSTSELSPCRAVEPGAPGPPLVAVPVNAPLALASLVLLMGWLGVHFLRRGVG